MPTEFQCPECDNSVLVPNVVAVRIGRDEQIGCNNTDAHEDGIRLVMWENE